MGRVWVTGGDKVDRGQGGEEGCDGGPVGRQAAGVVGVAGMASGMQDKATVAVKGQGVAVKGTVGLIGRGSMRTYDGGEGSADEGI